MPKLCCRPVLALLVVLAVPLAAPCGKTIAETLDDTTITTRVKTALLNDRGVGGLRIDVDTFRGAVTLTGRVKTAAERDQAIALARRVDGVNEVKDALQVVPDPATPEGTDQVKGAAVPGAGTAAAP